MEFKCYAVYSNGDREFLKDGTRTITENGITSLFTHIHSQKPLCKDVSAEIRLESFPAFEKGVALFQRSPFWSQPKFVNDLTQIPYRTQFFMFQNGNGNYTILLPLAGDTYTAELIGSDDGLILQVYCGNENTVCDCPVLVMGEGMDPYAIMEKLIARALHLLGNAALPRRDRKFPDLFEYLGWCSWDAMEIRVSEDGLMEKLEEFKAKNIPVRWAIIDDMWADVPELYAPTYANRNEMFEIMHRSKLNSFEGDPTRFPLGLKHCIDRMHEAGVKVGIWHAVSGYWNGFTEDGPIAKALDGHLLRTRDNWLVPGTSYEDATAFYDHAHGFLKDCGADFVKVDNQSELRRFFYGAANVCEAVRNHHRALEESVEKRFNGALINCMGMANENFFNRPSSAVSRCSNDFLPEDSAWFNRHLLQCSFNSFYQGTLYWCDWDMWWTDDAQATKNSILHAVSGGPIYVSDKIGRSNPEHLKPLCFSDGRILRCDAPAVPTLDCMVNDPSSSGKAFKIKNRCGNIGVIAAFNASEDNAPVSLTLSPADCDLPQGDYAVYEYCHKTLTLWKAGETLTDTLTDNNDFRLYTFTPIVDGFAVIGDPEKMLSARTVLCADKNNITLQENSTCLVYSEAPLSAVCVNGQEKTAVPFGDGYLLK